MYQWRGMDWADRVCKAFPADNILHSAKFFWKSCEDGNSSGKGKERGERGSNPGETDREKRTHRTFRTRMAKRFWVSVGEEARCVPGTKL